MAKLTTKSRKSLPTSEFALPGRRKFPVDTKARAANAKARAKQGLDKGTITRAEFDKIVAKANAKLRRAKAKSIQSASEMLNKRK